MIGAAAVDFKRSPPPRNQDHVMLFGKKPARQMPANETCAACDCDLHDLRAFLALRRYKT
jgi:hypothetical protein